MREKYIVRSDSIAARLLGGEMVIMSASDSTLFTLNQVGTRIWQAADGATPLTEIIEKLCQEYDVDQSVAMQDAEEFVSALASHGILRVQDHPISAAETPSQRA